MYVFSFCNIFPCCSAGDGRTNSDVKSKMFSCCVGKGGSCNQSRECSRDGIAVDANTNNKIINRHGKFCMNVQNAVNVANISADCKNTLVLNPSSLQFIPSDYQNEAIYAELDFSNSNYHNSSATKTYPPNFIDRSDILSSNISAPCISDNVVQQDNEYYNVNITNAEPVYENMSGKYSSQQNIIENIYDNVPEDNLKNKAIQNISHKADVILSSPKKIWNSVKNNRACNKLVQNVNKWTTSNIEEIHPSSSCETDNHKEKIKPIIVKTDLVFTTNNRVKDLVKKYDN